MIKKHIENLSNYFKDKKVVVAFSGGVDSTVLLEFALENAKSVFAITIQSSLVPADEQEFAIRYLKTRRVQYRVVSVNPLAHPDVADNTIKRCYYCKKLIFQTIIKESEDFHPDIIVEGSNTTDLSDYRPGLEAIKELGISSPFLELQISKTEIKGIAKILSLEVAEKPSTTCLATRIPYGEKITKERIDRIETAERIIKEITSVSVLRVRDHGEIARIEVEEEKFHIFLDKNVRDSIKSNLKKLGFSYVALDLIGYRQGSMNINIEGVKND